MATNEATEDILLCRRDAYYPGSLEEASVAAAGDWVEGSNWKPDGGTVTLRFPLPAGYEDWIVVYSNVSDGEPVGPVYMMFN